MIAAFYDIHVSISSLRELCNTSRLGTSIGDIIHAAEKTGLKGLAFKTTLSYLKSHHPFPCILHWRKNHYIVLYRIYKDRYIIGDPGHGIITLKETEFLEGWLHGHEKGIAVFFDRATPDTATANVVDQTATNSTLVQMMSYLKPYARSIGLLTLFICASSLISLVIPKTIQYMTDKGLAGKNLNIVWQILLLQFMLFGSLTLSNYLRNLIQTKLSTKLSVSIISSFLKKLLRLPISFFDTKNHADLYQRIDDHSKIESFLSTRLVSFIFSSVLVVCYTIQLLWLNRGMIILFVSATAISFLWFFMFMKKRKNLDYRRFGLAIEERHYLHDLISGMTEIKLNTAQEDKVEKWSELQNKLYTFKLASLKLNNLQQNGISIINQIKMLLVTFFCSYWVISGSISFGVMLSISYIVGQLASPVQEIMGFFRDYQDAKISFERLNEVQLKKDENISKPQSFPKEFRLGLNVKNLSFKYPGVHNRYILKNIDLFIPKGKITAIVGASGSGKTTLLKLLLAFYEPQQGNIVVDNQDLSLIDTDDYHKNCGVVMQDGFIYNTSIAQNVAMQEKDIDKKRVKFALETACLWDFVETLPQKYNTLLGTVGVSLSGGQKQRLLIARAVYRDPHFIFLDEATNALDANNEKAIMNNLEKFFIDKTVVVIAHRLSTVRNADQIIVLNNGEIDEIGTHHELTSYRGKYYELVKNQLELGQ
ncbi:peptidase domain-containing ABC transporter [Mucilaginibacter sp. KACC 22063]|uniref:peptidase domain-containing ABC transporter n=1 Tax=Mucilaginibacter sp. KACC 22063 TaxID=3025666 RepID=UPI0023658BF8|nr:peptidase domain-containing ABC transporter [Mucilaginibacter sp. KACC 22063]WDF57305.1 peptidase domain-containing ABC transporter [Mucilaginibacter sp. KACC 22063]